MKITALIADDSLVYRNQIRLALSEIPGVKIVGAVSNGKMALERLSASPVDLLIIDLEMPEMDGLQTIAEIQKRRLPVKIILFSSVSREQADTAVEALGLGATDFIMKPGSPTSGDPQAGLEPHLRIKALLEPKLMALFPESPEKPEEEKVCVFPRKSINANLPKIVLIGSSTGGPNVLEEIMAKVPPPLRCPIVIAQHMPPVFTTSFAERLGKVSGIPAFEAQQGMPLQQNALYVAPGDFHLRLGGTPEKPVALLDQTEKVNFVRPAVDPLFFSAAQIFQEHCLAFILTGMGSDGKEGALAVKNAGGFVVIQDPKSCTVFGMPGAVKEIGAYDQIATPEEIIQILREKAAQGLTLKEIAGG